MALQDRITDRGMAIPMWMMVDIDHGDVTSDNLDDFDPYAWARAVPRVSPIIHIKQSLMDKGSHRPFIAEFNAKGRIQPAPLLRALEQGGAADNEICLELSFKERDPNDRQVIAQIAESVAFWAPHIDTSADKLNIWRRLHHRTRRCPSPLPSRPPRKSSSDAAARFRSPIGWQLWAGMSCWSMDATLRAAPG